MFLIYRSSHIENMQDEHTHAHAHTELFNGPLSGTNRVNQCQKKHSHSPTHTHEEGFTQATRSALSQQGLLDPIKPAYNQSA